MHPWQPSVDADALVGAAPIRPKQAATVSRSAGAQVFREVTVDGGQVRPRRLAV